MLEFLLGTEERIKTKEIYFRAKADAALGKPVFILVPEQYSMYAEQELISALGLSAQNKIQVLTFSRLSNMIFSKLGPLRTDYIDKAGKYLLACRSMQLCEKKLLFFGKNAGQPGFASLMVSLISEFKRYGVVPGSLRNAAENIEASVLSAKLTDLALIYEKFNELVEENHSNAEDNLTLALAKIPQADFLRGSLYINYFRSFTPVEYEVLQALLSKMDICVSLCTNTAEDSLLFASQIATMRRLTEIAGNAGVFCKNPEFFNIPDTLQSPELLHLKQNYFTNIPQAFAEKPKHIHIVRPQNFYSEVSNAARTIKRLCRTKGYRLNDFLILTGSIENYELIIPSIFEEFDISCFFDQKVRLTESPFMRMIIAILEILTYGFSYERIMTILRSGFWNVSKNDADIFENYILAADLTHKQWNSASEWIYNPRTKLFDMAEINRIKSGIVNPILDLLDMFKGRKTIGNICENFCSWLNSLSICKTVEDKIELYRQDCNIEQAEQLGRVWSSFVSVINQISDCFGSTFAAFNDFYELFIACCSELNVGIVPPTQDKVIISEVRHFRSTGAKVVIVLGVTDKVFPKSYNTEGILSDAERNTLCEAGLLLAPDSFAKQKEEQFLIYSVFSTPQDELYLLSPLSDKEGKSLGSSEVLKRLKRSIFPEIIFETEDKELDLIEGRHYTFFELCARLFECGFDRTKLTPLWKSVYSCFENDTEFSKKISDFHSMYTLSGEPDAISKAMAKKLYGSPLTLSVSKLEKYNSCAFSFFMKYGLLAEERLLGGLKATDTGTILHDVLYRYFKDKSEASADYSKISRDECFGEITRLVNDFAKNSDNSLMVSSNYYSYMLMRLKSIATATAWKLVRFYSKSAFRPTGFEVSFGRHGALPPYEIPIKDGNVKLQGFIDRIDSADIDGTRYIAVTDYKSSEKRIDPEMIDAGITLQPLIYANAAAKNGNNTKPAAMMYLQMNDPILKFDAIPDEAEWESGMSDGLKTHGLFLDEPDVLSALDPDIDDKNAVHYITCDKKSRLIAELFDNRLKNAEKCAADTADKMLEGNISPEPPEIKGFDPCSYCPYSNICNEDN